MQQVGQWMLIVHVGRRHHGAVGQPRAAVNANVHLHAKVPLLTFARLMHLGVSLVVGILGRAGRTNDGSVHDHAPAHLHPTSLQYLAHRGKQLLAQLVLFQQPAKPQ
jgi:hypothetical protein